MDIHMEVKNFKVGPILGRVTINSTHIFGRGKAKNKSSSFGVCRIRKVGVLNWSIPVIRYQQPHFDYSSV